jgi:hypothetical protein
MYMYVYVYMYVYMYVYALFSRAGCFPRCAVEGAVGGAAGGTVDWYGRIPLYSGRRRDARCRRPHLGSPPSRTTLVGQSLADHDLLPYHGRGVYCAVRYNVVCTILY